MAGEKKDSKGGSRLDPFEEILFVLIILALLSGVLSRISTVFSGNVDYSFADGVRNSFSHFVIPLLKLFSYSVSVLSFFGILWSLHALTKINTLQNGIFNPFVASTGPSLPVKDENKRWERVLQHINSQNPNDWKFAILEADIILDDLLTTMQYHGETMGDKLKAVEKSDFTTIDLAWEAHKVRNAIAHEGADFLINEREAKRVIDLYRQIFQEFHFI